MLASPIFLYTVSAHTKIFMDRCPSLRVWKYRIENTTSGAKDATRKGLFISVWGTKEKKLFDGVLLSVKYFFDTLDTHLHRALLYRGLDFEGDVLERPRYLDEAYEAGKDLFLAIRNT